MDRHADDKHASRDSVAATIADTAASCGISLVASLPDGWITSLIARFDADARFRHVAVNREERPSGCVPAPSSVASGDLP
jgi:sulfopyruvate decarboxylase TPP-binding subunit